MTVRECSWTVAVHVLSFVLLTAAAFRINLLAGFLFAALFLAASPLLGWFYHDARVVPVGAALSLVFVLSGLTAIQRALPCRYAGR